MMRTILTIFLFAISFPLFAQLTVSGNVSAPSGEALVGATVLISGTDTGTSTDSNGDYRIVLPDGESETELTFAYVGHTSRTIIVYSRAFKETLNVVLEPATYMISEATVRATRASGDVPFAYQNVNKEELEENNLGQDVPFLLRWTPSAVVTSDAGTGIGYTGIRIRGSDPTRINVTVNGIPLNDAESQGVFWVNMPDFASSTNSIQIQRGVGTSTNGAGAFGASINLSTFENIDPYGSISVDAAAGSFGTLRGNLQLKSGLFKDKFYANARLSRIHSDGYIDRARADLESWYGELGMRGDRTSLTLLAFGGHEVTYQAWNGVPVTYADDEELRTFNTAGLEKPGTPYEDEVDNYRQNHVQLHFARQLDQWTLGGALHYTRGLGFFEQYKAAQDPFDYFDPAQVMVEPGGTDLVRRLWLDNHFFGGIFNLERVSSDQRLHTQIGGGLNHYQGLHYGEVTQLIGQEQPALPYRFYENDADKTDGNIFTKATYRFKDHWNGYLDLQYRGIQYDFVGLTRNDGPVDESLNYHFFNPKVGVFYENRGREAYGSFAIASHEPNRNDLVNTTTESRPTAEKLYDLELGYRRAWARAQYGVNLYWMQYQDQLVVTGELNDVGEYTRVNVPDSYRRGIEMTGAIKPMRQWLIGANLTLSQNEINRFTEFVDDWDTGTQIPIQHRRTDLALSPNVIGGGELTYRPSVGEGMFSASLLGKFVGKQYLDNTGNENTTLDPYFFANLRLRYETKNTGFAKNFAATLMVRNLFDARYVTNGWTYRYRSAGYDARPDDPYARLEGNDVYNLTGLYPQAGINLLGGLSFTF